MVMWLYEWKPLSLNGHAFKFGGLTLSGSGAMMFLICQVVLQDPVIKGSCDFIGGIPS